MHQNFTDRAGNGLIGYAVKFYAVGTTSPALYEATTDSYGRVNLDDYDGGGNVISEGLYDIKIVAGAEDGSDQWEYRVFITKGKLAAVSDDNSVKVVLSDDGALLTVYKDGFKKTEINTSSGRVQSVGGFVEEIFE